MKRIKKLLLLPMLFLSLNAFAQDGNNPISYSNLALQYNSPTLNGDAANSFMPSVAIANGIGSYLDNPASMALLGQSSFNFSVLNTNFNQESFYLNNSINSDRNKTQLSNLGFVYKLPTEQGSFVVGGSYNFHTNNIFDTRLNARNTESTITDYFKDPASDYFDLAFETYAIDYATTDSSFVESIFRIGVDYPGITQDAKISQTTNVSDYSLFMGTEFQKDFYFGLSAGINTGDYTFRRNFLELDEDNFYDGGFIDGSDIHNILLYDEIDADILSFNLRAGLIYSFANKFNVGLSYLIPTRMHITESYYSYIETNLDDGSAPFFYDMEGDFRYSIKQPGKLNIGLAAIDLNGFSISTSAELIDYSKTEIDLISSENFGYVDERALREDQDALNQEIADNYKTVVNLRAGLKYEIPNQFELKAAYAFLPGRTKNFAANKNMISGGIGINLTRDIVLDLSAQYLFWDDQTMAYSYVDDASQFKAETISQSINRLNIMAGLRFNF